ARLGRAAAACTTDSVPLPGALGEASLEGLAGELRSRLPALAAEDAARLVRLYGGAVREIVARVEADPAAGARLPGATGITRAEIGHALDTEMALTLVDLLERRARLLLFDPDQGLAAAEPAAAIAAQRLGWDAARTAHELDAYRALAACWRRF